MYSWLFVAGYVWRYGRVIFLRYEEKQRNKRLDTKRIFIIKNIKGKNIKGKLGKFMTNEETIHLKAENDALKARIASLQKAVGESLAREVINEDLSDRKIRFLTEKMESLKSVTIQATEEMSATTRDLIRLGVERDALKQRILELEGAYKGCEGANNMNKAVITNLGKLNDMLRKDIAWLRIEVERLDLLCRPGVELTIDHDPEPKDDAPFVISQVSGSRNDREWTELGRGASVREAIDIAIKETK